MGDDEVNAAIATIERTGWDWTGSWVACGGNCIWYEFRSRNRDAVRNVIGDDDLLKWAGRIERVRANLRRPLTEHNPNVVTKPHY